MTTMTLMLTLTATEIASATQPMAPIATNVATNFNASLVAAAQRSSVSPTLDKETLDVSAVDLANLLLEANAMAALTSADHHIIVSTITAISTVTAVASVSTISTVSTISAITSASGRHTRNSAIAANPPAHVGLGVLAEVCDSGRCSAGPGSLSIDNRLSHDFVR